MINFTRLLPQPVRDLLSSVAHRRAHAPERYFADELRDHFWLNDVLTVVTDSLPRPALRRICVIDEV